MTKEQISELQTVLFDFVKRVAGGKAAPGETEILPAVAAVLIQMATL